MSFIREFKKIEYLCSHHLFLKMKCTPTDPPTIVLGVTGSIAAFKAADLTSKLRQKNYQVVVIMTESATKLIQPQTFFTLSQQPVITSLWNAQQWQPTHIGLAEKSSLFVIAPASADVIAKLANGIADDALTTFAISHTGPILLFPAMNPRMWQNPATQENVETLRRRGIRIVDPSTGHVACGESGKGRFPEVPQILSFIDETMHLLKFIDTETNAEIASKSPNAKQRFIWKKCFTPPHAYFPPSMPNPKRRVPKVVISAGPTREAVDPVRFLSNKSSGKMGFALATSAAAVGCHVTLVAGPVDLVTPLGVNRVNVITAAEMKDAILNEVNKGKLENPDGDDDNYGPDLIIMAAAVADYKPAEIADQKIHKSGELDLHLARTDDILLCVKETKESIKTYNSVSGNLCVVGFAAETQNIEQSALSKMERKGLDMIVSNDVSRKDIGFATNENEVTIYVKGSDPIHLQKQAKSSVASTILSIVLSKYFSAEE